jgi:hypothetical protein
MKSRQRIAIAEETKRRIEERESKETADLIRDQQERMVAQRAAEERIAELVRQHVSIAAEAKRIIEDRESKETARLALEQQNLESEQQLIATCNARLEAERQAQESVQTRIAAEQKAIEVARQREVAELSAIEAANEKKAMQEQAIAALRESEEIEIGLSQEVREELCVTKSQVETGKLLQRLNKTHRVNRFSQAALVVSLLLCVGLWLGGAGTSAKADHSANETAAVKVAPEVAEAVALDSFKLSANLESALPMSGKEVTGKQVE